MKINHKIQTLKSVERKNISFANFDALQELAISLHFRNHTMLM